ncbi:hypothetical protein POF51_26505 [Brevibacillus sp. AG]|uniref:hypothetical protein n=1 Tax=Brevibacillus sp. AG TaxID=3020891 RepID=UPI00232B1552|nr:hypothetical protein [Brevibacillus sp. AG]MDC0764276.1 hypothetical protein [Brevibacillus sp. AG]
MILKFFKWLWLIFTVLNTVIMAWGYLSGEVSRFYWGGSVIYLLITILLFKWDAKRTAKKTLMAKTKVSR